MDMTHKPVGAANVIKTGPSWMYGGVMENRKRDIDTEAGLRPYYVSKDVLVHSPLNFNEETSYTTPLRESRITHWQLTFVIQRKSIYSEVEVEFLTTDQPRNSAPQYSATLTSRPWKSTNKNCYYSVFRFTATFDKAPQTAVNNCGAISGCKLFTWPSSTKGLTVTVGLCDSLASDLLHCTTLLGCTGAVEV